MYLKKAACCKVLFSKSITSIGVWSPPRFAFLFNSLFLFFLFSAVRAVRRYVSPFLWESGISSLSKFSEGEGDPHKKKVSSHRTHAPVKMSSFAIASSTVNSSVSSSIVSRKNESARAQKVNSNNRRNLVISRGIFDDIKAQVQSLRPDAKSAGIYGSQAKDDYEEVDVEYYFNYMGLLAVEGSYDRMYALLETGIHPADAILLFASAEGDTPKCAELIEAGANPNAKGLDGMTAIDVAGKNNADKKEAVLEILQK